MILISGDAVVDLVETAPMQFSAALGGSSVTRAHFGSPSLVDPADFDAYRAQLSILLNITDYLRLSAEDLRA